MYRWNVSEVESTGISLGHFFALHRRIYNLERCAAIISRAKELERLANRLALNTFVLHGSSAGYGDDDRCKESNKFQHDNDALNVAQICAILYLSRVALEAERRVTTMWQGLVSASPKAEEGCQTD